MSSLFGSTRRITIRPTATSTSTATWTWRKICGGWTSSTYPLRPSARWTRRRLQALQKPFTTGGGRLPTPRRRRETENKTYLSVNTVVGTDLDPKLYVAFQILEYALISAPAAPLKQALIDAGLGEDIMGGYESGILQPYFSVIAKNADKEQKAEFLIAVKGTLRRLADQGIDRKSLLAGLNYYEFRYREADYGSAPKGLMYGLWSMDSWLYDGDPLMHLEYQETFDFLKQAVEQGYFEGLIREVSAGQSPRGVILVTAGAGQDRAGRRTAGQDAGGLRRGVPYGGRAEAVVEEQRI